MFRRAFLLGCSILLGAGFASTGWAAGGCSPDNGGITVPDGFCAEVFAKDVGPLRHLTVSKNGTVYGALSSRHEGGGIVILHDANGNGHADSTHYFGDVSGTGIALHDGYLYFAETTRILRFKLSSKTGLPEGKPQTVVAELPDQHEHSARGIAFDGAGHLYV
ncbi:MAG: hypothetical protein ACRESR_03080, partial [Gammaproteobacteria bacterium]